MAVELGWAKVVRVWAAWTMPDASITDPALRWRAQLLASMMLVGVPLMAIVLGLLYALGGSTPDLPLWAVLLPLGGMMTSYVLARTTHWRLGAWVTALCISLTAAVDLAMHHRVYIVLYVGLAIAFGGMVLRKRDSTLMVALALIWWWSAPLWSSAPFSAHENATVSGFFVALGVVLAISLGLRQRIEQARLDELAKSEAHYRGLLEVTFEGLLVLKNERIIDLNPGFEQLCGRPRAELLGRPLAAVLTTEEPNESGAQAADRNCGSQARPGLREATGTRPDGEVFHVEYVGRGQATRRGLVRYVAVRDITERRRATLQLSIAHRAVAMGTLSSGIAREIDKPLSWMMTNLKMAQEGLRDEGIVRSGDPAVGDLRCALDDAVQGGRRVMSIVRDLKTLSREDERHGSTDIHSALDLACRIASRSIEARARLVRDYGHVPSVVGTSGRLGQVFLNLLGNAVDAIPKGERERRRITLRTRRATSPGQQGAEMVEIIVRDNGRGIPRAILPHVFDPFFTTRQVANSEQRGLGLSIARSIIDGLGGSIEVDSRDGEGTTFTVRVPVAERHSRALATARPVAAPTNEVVGPPSEPTPATPPPSVTQISAPHPVTSVDEGKARLLIIDDEPLLGKSLGRALRDYDVTFTEDPAHALDLCGATDFDVIVCDLLMPVVSGEDVHRHLLEHAPELASRMIFMTGGAFTEGSQRFLDSIPNPVFNKPFAPRDLSVAIRRVLERKNTTEPTDHSADNGSDPASDSPSLQAISVE